MKSRTLSMTSGWVTEPGTWSRDEESLSTAVNLDLSSPGIIAKRRGLSNNTLNSYSGCVYAMHSSPVLEREVGATALLLAVGNPTGGITHFRVGTRASTFASSGTYASDTNARPKLTTGPDGKDIVTTWVGGGVGGPLVPSYTANSMAYLGVPSGLGLDRLNTTTSGVAGFLPSGFACRYAVTFSLGDPTSNWTQQGAPGMTTVFLNTTINAVDVAIRLLLPMMFRTSATALPADTYWVQVYRSASQNSNLGEPPSELALVYSQMIEAKDIAVGYIAFTDVVPDVARGADLYTNILTGEDGIVGRGFLNSNEGPPQAKDIATWADCVWLASTMELPTQEIQLISVGGSGLINGDTIDIGGTPFIAVSPGPPVGNQFEIFTTGTASTNQRETALNLCDSVNRLAGFDAVYAYYVAGVVGQPGRIIIRGRTQTSVLWASTSNPTAFRIGTQNADQHELNGLAFSKPLQPHAFPLVNFFQLGRGDAEILRIMPYRDSLFVFKEDGIWRVTGTDFRTFSAQEFDLTFRLQSREALVALDDALYAWGVEGIARITDGGVEYIDAPIRNQVVAVQSAVLTTTMANYAFAVGRPRDGVVHFFYPVSNPGDSATDPANIVPCTVAFTWHARTQAWGVWSMQGDGLKIGYTCGTNNVADKLMTLGIWQAHPASGAYVHNERRTYSSADFTDPDMTAPTAPTMDRAAIVMQAEWRALKSDALGSAQWIRLRVDTAEADGTRQTTVGPLSIQMFGDDGLSTSASLSVATATQALPRTYLCPMGTECSRSHALSVTIADVNISAGCWLVSTSVDYRPVSTKAVR